MKTISYCSYKGGVGRTLLVAQTARVLSGLGKKVVVVDFDFDAPGLPSVFNIPNDEVTGGIYELLSAFAMNTMDGRNKRERKAWLKQKLDEYLLVPKATDDGEKILTGDDRNGSVRILACGKINDAYWKSLSAGVWLSSIKEDKDRERTIVRFYSEYLHSVLEDMGTHYLLIDARSGVSDYTKSGVEIASEKPDGGVVLMLTPTAEFHDAVKQTKACGVFEPRNELKKENIVYAVSRVPLDGLEKPEKIYKDARNKLREELGVDINNNVFRICSDMVLLRSNERSFDSRYKGREDDAITEYHEDTLKIIARICPGVLLDSVPIGEETPAKIWNKLYNGGVFNVSYGYQVFYRELYKGQMLNPGDKERNVAFKAKTFLGFINAFYDALLKQSNYNRETCKKEMYNMLYSAGVTCGLAFGKSLMTLDGFQYSEHLTDIEANIRHWCAFDTEAGFGKMEYCTMEKELKVKNLFIQDHGTTKERDYTAFFTGYVVGVLNELLNDRPLQSLRMKKTDTVGQPLLADEPYCILLKSVDGVVRSLGYDELHCYTRARCSRSLPAENGIIYKIVIPDNADPEDKYYDEAEWFGILGKNPTTPEESMRIYKALLEQEGENYIG